MIGELQLRGEQLAKHYWVAGEQVMIMIMMVAMIMTKRKEVMNDQVLCYNYPWSNALGHGLWNILAFVS